MDFSSYNYLSVGIIAIDLNERIIYANQVYADFLGYSIADLLGKHIKDALPNTRLDEVVRTGYLQKGVWQKTERGYLFGNRIPIVENGKVVGAFAELILHDTDELEELSEKLKLMEAQVNYLTKEYFDKSNDTKASFLFQSHAMHQVWDMVRKVAPLNTTVLLSGETGSGKEVVADLLYHYSGRPGKPFVKVNCAAIPNELMESEFFGYVKGAFTGASSAGKIGKFELADGGLLFLDEISSMPMTMQSKLLRVLQEKEIERLGGTTAKKIDMKIIAATNENLHELVAENKFRQDLLYRLNVVEIRIPPLRERADDILLLADFFLKTFFEQFNKKHSPLSFGASKLLQKYHWPGNVRELKNTMERLAIMCDSTQITTAELYQYTALGHNAKKSSTLKQQLDSVERSLILATLKRNGGNVSLTAKELDLNRATLYSKLKKYEIHP